MILVEYGVELNKLNITIIVSIFLLFLPLLLTIGIGAIIGYFVFCIIGFVTEILMILYHQDEYIIKKNNKKN